MVYAKENPLWNQNTKIKGKFSRLSYHSLYIGLLPNAQEYESQDFIDIMSFFSTVGYEEKAKKHSILPTGNYESSYGWKKYEF